MNVGAPRFREGLTPREEEVMAIWFRDNDGDDLIPLRRAADALQVRLQAVGKLGLPRYMVAKNATYKKKDIEALLMADITTPNALLRELQEEHRQAQIKQKAHPSRRYKPRPDLSPEEAKAAKQASKANRKKPPTRDEVIGGWHSSVSLNKPLMPPRPMIGLEAKFAESMREGVKEQLAKAEEEVQAQSGPAWEMMKFKLDRSK